MANKLSYCKYYKGESENPWDITVTGGFNVWRKWYWNLEKEWVEERFEECAEEEYVNLKRWGVYDHFLGYGVPLSLVQIILEYHNHVAEQSGIELDHDIAIDSFDGMYVKFAPLAKGVEQYFNYYTGEEDNPWTTGETPDFAMFWEWEKRVATRCSREGDAWLQKIASDKMDALGNFFVGEEQLPLPFRGLCIYIIELVKDISSSEYKVLMERYLGGVRN